MNSLTLNSFGLKEHLRKHVRVLKKNYAAQLAAMSEQICSKVLRSVWWREAGTLLLYYPLVDEVDVRPLIADAYRNGKRVLLPVCVGDDLELHLYEGEDSLSPGAFGIMEPQGPLFPVEDYPEIQVALIPGIAFDRAGHRLGRGRGYYDRFLAAHPVQAVGICYADCRMTQLPHDNYDRKLMCCVTEQKTEDFYG